MNYYDIIARGYNKLYKEEQLKKWEKVKNLISFKGTTLDIGCGTGVITRKINHVIGADSSIKMLEKCKGLVVVQADAEALPFKNESFDAIISFTVLQDVADYKKAICEIKRVLKKNGELLITVLDKNRVNNIREELIKKFEDIKEESIGKDAVFFRRRRIQHRCQRTS